jgi:hypothetical protein
MDIVKTLSPVLADWITTRKQGPSALEQKNATLGYLLDHLPEATVNLMRRAYEAKIVSPMVGAAGRQATALEISQWRKALIESHLPAEIGEALLSAIAEALKIKLDRIDSEKRANLATPPPKVPEEYRKETVAQSASTNAAPPPMPPPKVQVQFRTEITGKAATVSPGPTPPSAQAAPLGVQTEITFGFTNLFILRYLSIRAGDIHDSFPAPKVSWAVETGFSVKVGEPLLRIAHWIPGHPPLTILAPIAGIVWSKTPINDTALAGADAALSITIKTRDQPDSTHLAMTNLMLSGAFRALSDIYAQSVKKSWQTFFLALVAMTVIVGVGQGNLPDWLIYTLGLGCHFFIWPAVGRIKTFKNFRMKPEDLKPETWFSVISK